MSMGLLLGSVFMGDGCVLALPELGPDGTVKEEGFRGVVPLALVFTGGFMPSVGVATVVEVVVLLLAVVLPVLAAALGVGIPFGRITSLESFPGSGRLQNAFWLTGFVGEDDSVSGRFAFFFIGLFVPGSVIMVWGNGKVDSQ